MDTTRRAATTRAGRLGIVLTGLAATLALALGRAGVQAWPGWGTVPVEQALLALVLATAALLTGWVAVVLGRATVLMLVGGGSGVGPAAARPGWADRTTAVLPEVPRSVRVACLLLGTMAAIGSAPAQAAVPATVLSTTALPPPATWSPAAILAAAPAAAPAAPGDDASGRRDDLPVPQPGWTPTPRTAPPVASAEVGLVVASPRETSRETVVVRRGDTLWDLAARHLGPGSTTDDVAEEWPRWYAANRATIGPDPDLILPGQELTVPADEAGR